MLLTRRATAVKGGALFAVAALLAGACWSVPQAPGGLPVDGHDDEVDDAIAQAMAGYHEAGGESLRDRHPGGEHFSWNSLTAAATTLGVEKADDVQCARGAVRRGELTRLSCTLGRLGFEIKGDGYVGESSAPAVYVWLRRDVPSAARELDPGATLAGREVLAGEVDLYDLGGWRRADLDDTVAVAASIGETHTVLVAVRVQVADVDGALLLLEAIWQDFELPE